MRFWYSDYAHNKISTAGGASVALRDRHRDFAKIVDSVLKTAISTKRAFKFYRFVDVRLSVWYVGLCGHVTVSLMC